MDTHPRGRRLRVTLERVQMLDSKEPSFERYGEIRLTARVSTKDDGGFAVETRAPERGVFRVSTTPGDNFLELDLPIFEGYVAGHLEVELSAVEVDRFSADEAYQTYRRVHTGKRGALTGAFGPGDESLDVEELSDWRVWYRIEEV